MQLKQIVTMVLPTKTVLIDDFGLWFSHRRVLVMGGAATSIIEHANECIQRHRTAKHAMFIGSLEIEKQSGIRWLPGNRAMT